MLDREVEAHLKQIRDQVKAQQTIVQLLIHQILKNLETKPECENFTKEVVDSLEALKTQVWFGKEGIDAAIALTRSPVKR
ncbi:hypothetical protein [Pantoea piersonii]|uniref:hypothetical protein n=1 Tax=Pantoea piersonii TaxID=2364647 RepID=UPI0028A01698|nr:hypothetical protein [Pantoea piersonii]